MRRRDHGQAIRTAMKRAGLSIPALARATREVDPERKGVSQALIGFLVCADGTSARDTCGTRPAALISQTLNRPTSALFIDEQGTTMPAASTSTGEVDNDQAQGRADGR
ncbi:XRE family transcriptional regulator [Yinghuangia sp. YIM S09857]|uniref:XRE family transcriptional regulator n=1 Tax=Yinghuangia sp. YIM S09857 TaxID=3436929 RepID=UPI003F53C9AE